MTGETCGAVHRDHPNITCDRPAHQNTGFHRDSATRTVWEADPLPVVQGSGRGALAAIAARTTRHHHTGPVSAAVTAWKDRHA
jgi:hypothetical protein